jgi:hypothetical protein
VEEVDAASVRLRGQRGEERARGLVERGLRPARGGRGVRIELGDRDLVRPERDAVVVADEREVGASGDERRRLVGVGPVADRVAEAPELVDVLVVDRRQNGGERRAVRVDVGDDGGTQGGNDSARPGPRPSWWSRSWHAFGTPMCAFPG